ncbi:DNA gyrase subunit A [Candidatus Portiera aleyrodidarum]|uniref:DNA gyrase subunit A n=1 Tax=Candidatus Portiera aleyrodidarum TaxID=91844 RepID=A0A6S6S4V9_9GAMM|nr:DNA gyrase subunit A [Candidatus Portiera aleyrodidarum]CAA3708308.1 DNA gyrase subunit A [Candidatus Portiera aleyrodidarum]
MLEKNKEILPITIEDEIKNSYIDYAMSVIIGRAIPDIRDGLKPVHRRVIFAMHELNNVWNKNYLKSARVVGDVIGKYHPHGDSAVYDAIVRMAQEFSMRYVLIDGQGNFGSIDGDNAAAMRYTEVRLSRITSEFVYDLEKSTVDWVDNYDGTEKIPDVLPSRIPNLLINGTSGIAVGMATNIPPHNIKEVIKACLAFIDNKNIAIEDLMKYINGPDFPTSGIIHGKSGLLDAYSTGKGSIYIRAKYIIEKNKGNDFIIITELPYQVNKARLIEKIVELLKNKMLSGINELRDESDKDGLRIVIEIKRYESSEIILNNLFAHTQMEVVYSINMVAVDKGKPKTFNLKQIIEAFINQRIEVIKRRTLYELKKFKKRKNMIEGLIIAISNIDIVIEIIKSASSLKEAKNKLINIKWKNCTNNLCKEIFIDEYKLNEYQIKAIMDLRLHRLTSLESKNYFVEYKNTLKKITKLKKILSSFDYLMEIIRNELIEISCTYGDNRKTTIKAIRNEINTVDLINEEKMVVTVSRSGYAKIQPISVYQAQKRGGRGKLVTSINDEDVIEHLLVASTHDTILLFSDKGKVYWLKVYEIPQYSRISRGRPLVNLLSLDVNEKITAILAINDEIKINNYIFFATALGKVKRTNMKKFIRHRNCGIIALNLEEGDSLIGAAITYGEDNLIMLHTSNGKSIYFKESEVRVMGRKAMGVMGLRLFYNNKVISLIIIKNNKQSQKYYILTASEKGYGKRTILEEFNLRKRGGQGVIAMRSSKRNGKLVSAIKVKESDEIILITNRGNLIRTRVKEISCRSRNTQGVTLIRVNKAEKLVSVVRLCY